MTEPVDWIEETVRKSTGILEARQRFLKTIEFLRTRSDAEVAEFLNFLCAKAHQPGSPTQRLHLDFIRFHNEVDQLGYARLKNIYKNASERNWKEVMSLLRTSRFFGASDEESVPEGFAKRLSSLTLGERKQLSRNSSRKQLEIFLFDSDPSVIRELLMNPKVLERDVIRIASRHHAPTSVLTEIYSCDRWISRYRVKKALVFNPRTPFSMAVGLIHHLREGDLQFLIGRISEDDPLKEMALNVLEKKKAERDVTQKDGGP